MRNRYLHTLTSPTILAEQARNYGRSRIPGAGPAVQLLGADEQGFIANRDSFYMGTVGNDGWPYVQHRGGPKGFVRVLNATQLAFGDYNGNRQLISTGNVKTDDRVSLFFMDYPARERLKILGHARTLDRAEAGDLLEQLTVPPGAVIERVFLVDVVGFDWNCPKYITPRFTAAEVEELAGPLRSRIAELEHALAQKKP